MGGEPVKNNLKPMGVRKSGLVPHVLAAKPVSISKPPKPAVEEVYVLIMVGKKSPAQLKPLCFSVSTTNKNP